MTENEILMLLLGLVVGMIVTLIIAVQWTVHPYKHYLKKHQPRK